MTLLTSLKTVWADPSARALSIGLGFLVIGLPIQQIAEHASRPAPAPAPVAVAAPAPAPAPAPTPKVRVRNYDPVGRAMLTAARNNYHRCRQENGTDILGYGACEDARQTYEYARDQFAN